MDKYFSDDSEWNEAKAYLYRIHVALMNSDDSGSKGDHRGQLNALYTLHRELVAQMKPEEKLKAEDLHRKARRIINDGRFNPIQEQDRLYEYESHLRTILKLRKMDLPRSKDPSRALLD